MAKKAAPSKRKPNPVKPKGDDVCFMIMPFGGWFDEYYLKIYKPAIEDAGLIAHRADDLYRPSTITNDIWEYTKKSKVILADLSERNANVFYELGLAHAIAKPAVMITQSMDDVPFDLRSLRIIVYDRNDPGWGETLRYKITKSLLETVGSPSEAILPAFLSVTQTPRAPSISENERQFLELKREIDLVKNEVIRRSGVYNVPDRVSSSFPPTRSNASRISPVEAGRLIETFVHNGIEVDQILRFFESHSFPKDWLQQKITGAMAQRVVTRVHDDPRLRGTSNVNKMQDKETGGQS